MARGGYGRGLGIPLKDRVRVGPDGVRRPSTELPADDVDQVELVDVRPAAAEACPGRHCWIADPVDGAPGKPALLVEWRHDPAAGWLGRVVYGAQLRPGRWAIVEEWLPAAQLVPRRSRQPRLTRTERDG